MISKELIQHIVSLSQLSSHSIHGPGHWARVLENGRMLASQSNARLPVVEYFAIFHDSCRISDGRDPAHGRRGAELAASLRNVYFELSDDEFSLLEYACTHHTRGFIEADITIQVCWDSDRLDLPRAGIWIIHERLCTNAAKQKDTIRWAEKRSRQHYIPENIFIDWGLDSNGKIIPVENS